MKIINLLPKEEGRQLSLKLLSERLLKFYGKVLISILVFAAALLVLQQISRQKLKSTEEKIVQNQAVLETSDNQELRKKVLTLNQWIQDIQNIRNQQTEWSEVLVELSAIVPSEIQLNNIMIERSTGKIDINGQGKTREAIIDIWARIRRSKYFKNINFPLENLEKATDSNFHFTFYVNFEEIKFDDVTNH